MKKILHLITGLNFGGGAEKFLYTALTQMKKVENVVCCVNGQGEYGKLLEKKGIKVYYLDMKNIFDIGIIRRYKQVLKIVKPDIQVNYLIHADFFGRIFGRFYGVKKIISFNRLKYIKLTHRILDRITINSIDLLIANSKNTYEFFKKKFNLKDENIRCITNGIDLKKIKIKLFNKPKFKKELGLEKTDKIITCVARLDRQKDHKTLIRALTLIDKNTKLILCGVGKEDEELKNFTKKLNLLNRVLFLGNREDIDKILKITDVFVLPSLYEGMSNALIESMAYGCASVVSDIPENTELIIDNYNGLKFNVGDFYMLKEQIDTILKDEKLKKRLQRNAMKTIKDEYDLKKIIISFENLLIEIK